jgi:hypothetical protein
MKKAMFIIMFIYKSVTGMEKSSFQNISQVNSKNSIIFKIIHSREKHDKDLSYQLKKFCVNKNNEDTVGAWTNGQIKNLLRKGELFCATSSTTDKKSLYGAAIVNNKNDATEYELNIIFTQEIYRKKGIAKKLLVTGYGLPVTFDKIEVVKPGFINFFLSKERRPLGPSLEQFEPRLEICRERGGLLARGFQVFV